MIVMVNRATKDTFSGLKILYQVSKIRKKGLYGNDRDILP